MLDMLMFSGGNVGYAQVQQWSMMDKLMCISGQWWIYSCAEVVIDGYTYLQMWSMVDVLRCSGGQQWIYSGAELVNDRYAQAQWWSIVDMLRCRGQWRDMQGNDRQWSTEDMLM